MVSFDRIVDFDKIHKVKTDNFKASYEATTHFIKNGYTQIACVSNAPFLSISQERLEGYKCALKDHKIKIVDQYIQFCAHGGLIYKEVETVMNKLMKNKKKPDAILACSDKITTNIVRYCQHSNISIPKEVSLVGFSNLVLTDLLVPSLSIVMQPAYEMGRVAAELLIKNIENNNSVKQFENINMPAVLHQRASSSKKTTKP
jgi:LacI family transcriptional regulator